jgi:hypothetical protein
MDEFYSGENLKTLTLATAPECIATPMTGGRRFPKASLSSLLFAAGIFVAGAAPAVPAAGNPAASVPAASAASSLGRDVELNGAPMPAGATLFPGDVVRLGDSSTAALRFGNSMVLAAPLTELVVEAAGVTLRAGRLQVRANSSEAFAIYAPFFRVDIATAGGAPSSAEIRLGATRAQVSAIAGTADLTAKGISAPYTLHAGETATLDATDNADPAAPPGQAGQTTAAAAKRPLAPIVITIVGSAVALGIGVWQATRPTVSVSIP